jgi:hypothetical protein
MKDRYRRLRNDLSQHVADRLRFGMDTWQIAKVLKTTEDRVYNLIAGYGGIKEFLEEWP